MSRQLVGGTTSWMYGTSPVSTGPLTIIAWVKPNSFGNFLNVMGLFNNAGIYVAKRAMASTYFRWYVENGAEDEQIDSGPGTTGTWQLIGGATDGVNKHYSIYGSSLGGPVTLADNPTGFTTLIIGDQSTGNFGSSGPFDGKVSYLAIWNKILTQSDLNLLASGIYPTDIEVANLVACWPLNGAGSTETDTVSGASLTVAGANADADNPTLTHLATLSITAPAVSSSVTVGTSTNITWTSSGSVSNNLTIQLSKDNGSTWTNLFTGVSNSGTHTWTPVGIPSTTCLIKITDANQTSTTATSGEFTISQANTSNLPTLISAEITNDSSGLLLQTVWDRPVNYFQGTTTTYGMPWVTQVARREIDLDPIQPHSGNGTTTLTLSLRHGRPINQFETGVTIDIPVGLVIDATSNIYTCNASVGVPVTNNSTRVLLPRCRIISELFQDMTGTYTAEATASSHMGNVTVQFTLSDGITTLTSSVITTRTACSWQVYHTTYAFRHAFDLTQLRDGQVTLTATATCVTLGTTITDTQTFYNDSHGTWSASTITAYVDVNGNDANNGLTPATAKQHIQNAIYQVAGSNANRAKIVCVSAGRYDPLINSTSFPFSLHNTVPIIITKSNTLNQSDVVIGQTGSSNEVDFNISGQVQLQGITVDLSEGADTKGQSLFRCTAAIYKDCYITARQPAQINAPTAIFGGGYFWNCTIENVHNGPSSTPLMRGTQVLHTGGDFATNSTGSIFDCQCSFRGDGRHGFTLQYTQTGPATIAWDSTNVTLVDPVNGTTTLAVATYNTNALMSAAIAAKTGWTSATISGNETDSPTLANPFAATSALSQLTWVNDYGPHADLNQLYTNENNYIVEYLTELPFNDKAIVGVSDNLQDWWFDHNPIWIMTGATFAHINCVHMRLFNGARSGMHGYLNDMLMIYCTMPQTRFDPINAAGDGVPYIPSNLVIINSVFRGQNAEDLTWPGWTVQYNSTGPAYISKIGNNLQLVDPVNGTTTFDLSNATNFPDTTHVATAIAGVTGWSATNINTLNTSAPPSRMRDLNPMLASAGAITVPFNTADPLEIYLVNNHYNESLGGLVSINCTIGDITNEFVSVNNTDNSGTVNITPKNTGHLNGRVPLGNNSGMFDVNGVARATSGSIGAVELGTLGITLQENYLPSNHNGNITVHITANGFTYAGTETASVSGLPGWAVVSQNLSGSSGTVILSCPAVTSPPNGSVGILTISDSLGHSTSVTIITPTLAVSPSSFLNNISNNISLIGNHQLWTRETASTLFSVSGLSGNAIINISATSNITATATITGTGALGILTIKDNSTGATTSLSLGSVIPTYVLYFVPITNARKFNYTENNGSIAKYNVIYTSPTSRQYISLPNSSQSGITVNNLNNTTDITIKNPNIIGSKAGISPIQQYKVDYATNPNGYTIEGQVIDNITNTTVYNNDGSVNKNLDVHFKQSNIIARKIF